MIDAQTITQLIEDLKAAEEGTRELDARIQALLHFPKPKPSHIIERRVMAEGQSVVTYWTDYRGRTGTVSIDNFPFFTHSIDAAMTTILEGWSFRVMKSGTGDQGQAEIWDPMKAPSLDNTIRVIGCASPAIALCIASLSAMLEELEKA